GHGYGMYRIEHCLCPEQLGLRHKCLSQMRALAPQLTEDDGAGAVEQDAMLGVPLDGSGESEALDVTSDRGKLLRLVTMVDPGRLLLDYRSFVDRGGHIGSG